jgi:hypothetical protein
LPGLRLLRADQFGDYNDRSEVRHSDPLALSKSLLNRKLLIAKHDPPLGNHPILLRN